MYTAIQRSQRIKNRLRESDRRREKNRVLALGGLCLVLCAALLFIVGDRMEPRQSMVIGMSASILLQESAGSYVLVGVVSFSLAVTVTALCFRWREKEKQKDSHKDRDDE